MSVHVIGAGLAGLACAVRLSEGKQSVIVHEATAHGGGRCRSFFDGVLNRRIDNGNHLLFSGNRQAMAYLRAIGTLDTLIQPKRAVFDFLDLENGERWQVKPGRSRLPFWLFCRHMRVPGSSAIDHLAALKLARASKSATVTQVLGTSEPLFRKLWQPLCVSVLNTPPEEASAALLWPVLKQILGQGEAASRPCLARDGLSESFIDPALAVLQERGGEFHFNHPLKSIRLEGKRANSLTFAGAEIILEPGDKVVLAVPAESIGVLLPELPRPDRFHAIVNAHFLLPHSSRENSFLGLIGGVSHWLFVRGDIASVTVSAADDLAVKPSDEIARILWPEVLKALELGDSPVGSYRIIKEKRATFAQTPEQVGLRPNMMTPWKNVLMAGDWTDTGLPATIEGAITSGHRAAEAILIDPSTLLAT